MDEVFEKRYSSEVGRYLVSKKKFKAGDKVFAEKPVLMSPGCPLEWNDEEFVCYGCSKVKKREACIRCPRCKWFACSDNCINEIWHTEFECDIFETKGIPPSYNNLIPLTYLRALVIKEKHSDKWKEMMDLTDYVEVQSEESRLRFEAVADKFLYFFNVHCDIDVDKDLILKLIRIIKINMFEVNRNDADGDMYLGKLLFSLCSLLMNDCDPNLDWILLPINGELGERWNLILFARKDVNIGDTLSISYLPRFLNRNTVNRREKIREILNFNCHCYRCKDSSEFGSNFSGVVCNSCSGIMLPVEPLSSETHWRCIECDGELTNVAVLELTKRFNDSLKLFTKNPNLKEACQQLDSLIEHCGNKYHLYKNHSDVMRATVRWLQRVNLDTLLGNSVTVDTFYNTLMIRVQNCIKVYYTVGARLYLGICEGIMAKVIIKYCFKSKDYRTIEDSRYSLKEKKEILKRVDNHIRNGIQALRLSSELKHQKLVKEMEEMLAFYGEKLREINLQVDIPENHPVHKGKPACVLL